jgi:hypothetical protein
VRGSQFENVGLKVDVVDASRLGIVNSTFSPPLEAATLTVQPPVCGTNVAGERVCDERAQCAPALGGGVQCACIGEGLRYKPGFPEDGRRCEQGSKISSILESDVLSINVKKPGSYGRPLRLSVRAEGETPFLIEGAAEFTLLLRGGARSGPLTLAMDEPIASVFGQQIMWSAAGPPGARNADLDGNALKYSESKRLEFDIHMNCTIGSGQCAADGEVIETVFMLSALASADGENKALKSQVSIRTLVEAVPSCSRSTAKLTHSGGALTPLTPQVQVEIGLVDVDGLLIGISMPRTTIRWSLTTQPSNELSFAPARSKGGDSLLGEIPLRGRSDAGEYELVVTLEEGWDEATGKETTCVIQRETVTVVSVCGLGEFRNKTDASDLGECSKCAPGYFSSGGGVVTCSPCRPGAPDRKLAVECATAHACRCPRGCCRNELA